MGFTLDHLIEGHVSQLHIADMQTKDEETRYRGSKSESPTGYLPWLSGVSSETISYRS